MVVRTQISLQFDLLQSEWTLNLTEFSILEVIRVLLL